LTCCSFVIDVYVNVWYFHNVFRFIWDFVAFRVLGGISTLLLLSLCGKVSWKMKRYGKYRRKENWIVKKIWKIRKKSRLNSEMIWKIWKKIVKWYGKYGRKISWIVKWYGKYYYSKNKNAGNACACARDHFRDFRFGLCPLPVT
jgi:uncharacterized membrane protein YraQ (UPF0718 family)